MNLLQFIFSGICDFTTTCFQNNFLNFAGNNCHFLCTFS